MPRAFRRSSLVLATAITLLGPGCERLDASHCWNRQRDDTCAARGDALAYCSPCASAFDGCVEQPVDSAQCPAVGATTALDTGTTSSTGTSDDATSVGTGMTTLDPGTDTTAVDGSDTEAPPTMECGNGVLEGNEVCDGSDFGEFSCADFGGNGVLACNGDCTLNVSQCGGPDTCGDGVVEAPEQCDGKNLDGMTCADVLPQFPDGELRCNDCTYDWTNCCKPNLATCGGNSECCSGTCTLLACT